MGKLGHSGRIRKIAEKSGVKYFRLAKPGLFRLGSRSLGLTTHSEWRTWARSEERPWDIPRAPESVYSVYKDHGWNGYPDWRGKRKTPRGNWMSFKEAREFPGSLGLAGHKEWKAWTSSGNRPPEIPTNPDIVYKNKGWAGIRDWLGTD